LNIIVNKESLDQKVLDRLKIREWVIFIWCSILSTRWIILLLRNAFIIFSSALFEEYFS